MIRRVILPKTIKTAATGMILIFMMRITPAKVSPSVMVPEGNTWR
jgi:hypothetical protein